MSRLTDELEQKRLQRAADMREVQNPTADTAADTTIWALYTFQPQPAPIGNETPVTCHIYAPAAQEQCQQAGRVLQEAAAAAREAPLSYMVLPVEPLPGI